MGCSGLTPAMDAVDCGDDQSGFKRKAEESMRDAAMMLEADNRAANAPKGVDVWELGCNSHSERCVCGMAIEASARKAGAREDVGDRLHAGGLVAGSGLERRRGEDVFRRGLDALHAGSAEHLKLCGSQHVRAESSDGYMAGCITERF